MKNHRKKTLKVGNNFYREYFLQHFEGFSRVSFFHLNKWDNEGDSSSFNVLSVTVHRIYCILEILSKFMLTEVTKFQP